MVVDPVTATVAQPALSEVYPAARRTRKCRAQTSVPGGPPVVPRSHEATRALSGGATLAAASAWPVGRLPNVAKQHQDWVTFHSPPPKEFIIFLHQWVCVAFSLPDIPSKLLLLRLTVQVTITGTGVMRVPELPTRYFLHVASPLGTCWSLL